MDELLSRAKTSAGPVSLRLVLRTRLFFGFYPHLASRASLRLAAHFYCIALSSTLITILLRLLFNDHSAAVYLILPSLSDYVLCVLVSLITGETYFLNYCKVIEQVDIKLDVPHLPLLTRPAKYIFIFFSLYHVLEDLCSSLLGTREILSIFSPVYFISIAAILHGVIHINFLDLLRSRLAILRRVFELHLETRYGNITDNKIESINNCMQIYKSLIENLDATFFWPKVQIIVRFTSCFAFFISQGAFVVWRINHKESIRGTLDEVTTVLSCVIVFFLACLPAIFGELINKEVDEFKTVIGNQLIVCDDSLRDALTLAADYLQLRPFGVKVFCVFPLNASLVLTFAGLCTANLIVLVQITGLMDFCTFNRQLSKTRTRIELATSFWQEAAVYINNYFVAQDFVYSDDTFQEMLMLAHACLMREASQSLLGAEPEQEHTLRAARQARQMQDTPHATELYLQLVTENGNNANSWRELATCLMDEDVELARVCINEALLLNPRHPLTLLSKGSMLYKEDPESAELFFTAILALYPFWTFGWVVVQAFYVERQEFLMADKIKQCINEIRAQNLSEDLATERGWEKELGDWWYPTPLLPSTNQFLEAADLLLRLRAIPLAEVCLARALSCCGMSPAYGHLLALACRLRGDVDNALCHLQEAFQSFGEVNYLRSLEAECFRKQDAYNAALASFEKAGNCVNGYSILNALPGREPQRARSVLVELLRRQPSAYAWMALADDWLMRQAAAGKIGGAGDADVEVAMSACAVACAEQALRVDRRFARAWALLAQHSKPKARRPHCKTMATACGYKWFDEDLELSGAQQSQCHLLSAALQECRCNLCETAHNPDCQHLECECVKWIVAAGIVRWMIRVQRIIDRYLEDVPSPERIVLAPPPA